MEIKLESSLMPVLSDEYENYNFLISLFGGYVDEHVYNRIHPPKENIIIFL